MSAEPPVVDLTGFVAAPAAQVWHLLVEARRRGGGGEVTVDEEHGTVAVDGAWWYGGIDVVEPEGEGTRIVHRVVNKATGPLRLLARAFLVRPYRRHAREDFAFLLGTIGQRLGCHTRIVDPDGPSGR